MPISSINLTAFKELVMYSKLMVKNAKLKHDGYKLNARQPAREIILADCDCMQPQDLKFVFKAISQN